MGGSEGWCGLGGGSALISLHKKDPNYLTKSRRDQEFPIE